MRFTDDNVDIPDSLVGSLSSNSLVVFVGAGVSSRAYPNQKKNTYYPLFKDLVWQIAYKLGKTLSSEETSI